MTAASSQSSLQAFRVGLGIASVLVIVGGLTLARQAFATLAGQSQPGNAPGANSPARRSTQPEHAIQPA